MPGIETLAAVLMSLAAVSTAWSAYQATRWSGEMARSFNQAAGLRVEATRVSNEAAERTGISAGLVQQWIAAEISDQPEIADAIRSRMRPSLAAAMATWLGNWQRGEPLPPGDPFTEGEYTAPESLRAVELSEMAEAAYSRGVTYNQRADNYVLTGVVFALALFFGGMSSRLKEGHNAAIVTYIGVAFGLVGIVVLVIQPKSFSI
jgi:hypothetical protein